MIFYGTSGHVIIHEESLISISTIPDEIDKIFMVQETQHEDFDKELLVSLKSMPVKLLDGNHLMNKENAVS